MNLYFYSFSPIVISDTSISSIKALRSDQFSLVKGGIVVLIVIILVVFLLMQRKCVLHVLDSSPLIGRIQILFETHLI
jgi:hypothetical protein